MNFAEISIRRPIFIAMIIMSVVVLGGAALSRLPVDLFPDIEIPWATVVTVYPGASPEEMETSVTDPIEEELSSVGDLDQIDSSSAESASMIFLQFAIGSDLDNRVAEVREKIDLVKNRLPDGAEDPLIMKIDPEGFPILFAAVSAPRSEYEVRKTAEDVVKKQLENIPGVASVQVIGGQEREIHVDAARDRLIGHNLSILQVAQALARDNLNVPAGKIKRGSDENLVRLMGKYESVEEIADVEIPGPLGLVKVGDVAKVEDGFKDREQYARLNRGPAVLIGVVKQSGANTVMVSNSVKKTLGEMSGKHLPSDYEVETVMDMSQFVVDALNDVKQNLMYGILFTTIMVLLFLKDVRATFIIFLAMPTALIGSFIPIYGSGFSINFMSLMGLAIAVGTLVDNSVVTLENIYRHLEMGKTPMRAAADGVKEVGLAVAASGATNICVFIPVAFMTGMTGQFFKEFGMAVVFATVMAIFTAFTLTPALASRLLTKGNGGPEGKKGPLARLFGALVSPILFLVRILVFIPFDFFFGLIQRGYPRLLAMSLRARWLVVVLVGAVFYSAIYVSKFVGSEYVPSGDQGEIYVMVEMPAYATLDDTDAALRRIEEIAKPIPEVAECLASAGSDISGMSQSSPRKGYAILRLTPFKERERSTEEVVQEIRLKVAAIPDATLQVMQANMGGPPGELPLQIDVTGPVREELIEVAARVEDLVRLTPGAMDVKSSWLPGKPEIRVTPNKEKMARMGLDVASVGYAMRVALEGDDSVKFTEGSDEYDILVRFDPSERRSIDDVRGLPLLTQNGVVRLGAVADVRQQTGPVVIRRKNGMPVIQLEGNLGDIPLAGVVKKIEEGVKTLDLPKGYFVEYEGQYADMQEMTGQMGLAMALAVVFVYMVMAAQFESLLHPFVIMFTLPLTYIGVAWSLFLSGKTFNMMSQIGIVLLIGIVVNNGILLIDFINQRRAAGTPRNTAVLESGPLRLRPILITSLTTIIGMVPAAFFAGSGGLLRAPMAIVGIGGLTVSTLLTLIVIPVIYTLADDLQRLVLRLIGRRDLPPVWGPAPRAAGSPGNGGVEPI